jgi:DNA-binding response OmpR family regulator
MSLILIAEDEARIASFLEKGLRREGFATETVGDGETAADLAEAGGFDLVVLDIGLPELDGFAVLRRVRARGVTLPIIILTAREEVSDMVAGLEGGADDYVRNPFAFDELLARIRLRLRDPGRPEADALQAGGISLDLRTRRAVVDGAGVDLTAREFALAEAFVRHPDQVLSREQLLSRVWGFVFDPGSNVVEVYVRYLRRKLGEDRIETVRGAGYRLRVTPPHRGRLANT